MELGRIIKLTKGEDKAIIPTRWLTKIFVFGDVVSFLVQGGGGVMAGNSLDSMKTGEKLVQLGLAIQIVFFALFIATAIVFHIRMRRDPYQQLSSKCHTCWQKHLSLLYATSIVILIRCLFRLIEYVQGNSGYLISHEAYLYVFDATLMFLTMVLFAVVHPSELNALLKGGKAKAIQKIVFLRSVDCGNSEELNELQRF
ncbi:RTA1 domain-containing protein [Aspergillus fischeri NRRL 181]|uniref:RTA1 domain protein n=1 Tax=Neosartorya fischeri (strain ATCC 1020 / DSM 3700 / CBS 544.65 / FGSC A1164 / JCM 1740 / NRRL 181 / WB 181) TaxID=331117 RepID=A1DNP8_NEOFI|nr:conserved hypothetical protein [Aspergillus fischeri NRRL 181]EAW16419.1 conserved hypothetical protein [Aspergillus fischeri NRRL 181]